MLTLSCKFNDTYQKGSISIVFDCQNPIQAKEDLELAKKNYEALNTQLLEELPGFTEKCMALVVDCLETFAVAQNRLYFEIQQDYKELLQVQIRKQLKYWFFL